MNTNINHPAANQQWNNLYDTLQRCGAQIELIEPQQGWPDMTFTANAGLLYKEQIIISHFKFKERQGEASYFAEWFIKKGFHLINTSTQEAPYFEGAGDALLAGNKLFAGYGFRSDIGFYEAANYIDKDNIVYCELVDPYYYHIDTCFCPINSELAIWFPSAFSKISQQKMQQEMELIPVMETEAKKFACNAIAVDKQIILPAETPQIKKILEGRGFDVQICQVDEFLKAGGACKCLTMRID